MIEEVGNSGFTATFDDGSVVGFVLPGAVVPSSKQVTLTVISEGWDASPLNHTPPFHGFSARDDDGRLLWLVQGPLTEVQAEAALGVPLEAVQTCTYSRYDFCLGDVAVRIFDYVVKTTPEQRISANETSFVKTDAGTYAVDWYSQLPYDENTRSCQPEGYVSQPEYDARIVLQANDQDLPRE